MFFIISILLLAFSIILRYAVYFLGADRNGFKAPKSVRRHRPAYVCSIALLIISNALFILCASLLETAQTCGSLPFEFLNNYICRWCLYFDNESVLKGFHTFLKGLFAVYLAALGLSVLLTSPLTIAGISEGTDYVIEKLKSKTHHADLSEND